MVPLRIKQATGTMILLGLMGQSQLWDRADQYKGRGLYRVILVMRNQPIVFSVKRECRKLFFVTRDLKVSLTREEFKFFTDIRDFSILTYVMLRRSPWIG